MGSFFRKFSIIAAALVLVAAVLINKKLSEQKEPPKKRPIINKEKEVEVILSKSTTIPASIDIQGRLVAFNKTDIFAEVSGMLKGDANKFKVGNYFKKGDILASIDDEEALLNLYAQRSALMNAITSFMPDLKIDYPASFTQWKNYIDQYNINQSIQPFPNPLSDQEKFFIAARNIHSQYYNIKSLESRLNKYTVYAPFSGVITQANINAGSLIRVGQQLGQLMNTSTYELEATTSMSDLKYIKVGNTVTLHSTDVNGSWTGRVKRISDQIDPNTQSVIVYIGVNGRGLREGMYLNGNIAAASFKEAVEISREMLIKQNSVYLVQNNELVLQPIELIKLKENTAIIKGLPEGSPLLKTVFSGAHEGMKVRSIEATSSGVSNVSTN